MRDVETPYRLPRTGAPRLALAPMAEYTDAAMRLMCSSFGAAWTVTEMVNAFACARGEARTWQLLETFPGEAPVVAQLYGDSPEALAEAAGRVAATGRFVGIDLNAGCPVRRIVACGAGSALIERPELLERIVAAMTAATSLPVSVKTRPGPRPDRVLWQELLAAAESGGAQTFCLHARFTSQGHGGAAQVDFLRAVKAAAKIPVVGNGGVKSRAEAERMIAETGVDGVLIGRAAIGHPRVFSGREPTRGERLEDLRRHLELTRELAARRVAAGASEQTVDYLVALAFRLQLFRYLSGLPGSNALRGKLHLLNSEADIRRALAERFGF